MIEDSAPKPFDIMWASARNVAAIGRRLAPPGLNGDDTLYLPTVAINGTKEEQISCLQAEKFIQGEVVS
ncbi:MAG: hypothetical protein ACREJN_03255 [Nitrospiraceae bacterium]